MTDVIAVIPARFGSTRFPGKPLAPIAGVPMVVRVLHNVQQAVTVARTLVATDDERIAAAVRAAGGEAVMTDPGLPSGTDRVWAAASSLDASIVVNVQGDEPLLPGGVLDALVQQLEADPEADIATPVVACPRARALSPDIVTVARDEAGRAWYFSRSPIPWGADPVWRHVGVYAFRAEALRRFVGAPPTALEQVERLEQLRALSLGLRIVATPVDAPCLAVDRPEDVLAVERRLLGQTEPPAVRLVVLDVDGVLTDGRIVYPGEADQVLSFDVKDGYGVVALIRAGVKVAILSARDSKALRRRAQELGIVEVRAGVEDKAAALARLSEDLGIPLDQACYLGDDEPDLVAMGMVGVSAAPADAVASVRARAAIPLQANGGRGAVRELAELILSQQLPVARSPQLHDPGYGAPS